ncbi:MAG: DUF362 domain-containing protein [Actinomycetota bacterium]
MEERKRLVVLRGLCTGCKLCEKNCPTGAIRVNGGKARINYILCNDCNRCVIVCPSAAIKQETVPVKKPAISDRRKLGQLGHQLNDLRVKLKRFERDLDKIDSRRG